mgnify:CR=1 FL=1
MKDKTKKWLVTAGLAVVCVGLVFGISRVLYREPVQEAQIVEKDANEMEITLSSPAPTGVPAPYHRRYGCWCQSPSRGFLLCLFFLYPPLFLPVCPPVSQYRRSSADGTPEETEKKPSGNDQTPKTGDTKDGMVYVEGFGWLSDEGAGSGTYAGDMYENGNKIGIME